MPTMVVLVNLKDDVPPEEYERWLDERYVPAVLDLPSVDEWRGHRVGSLAEAEGEPPYGYVVTVEIKNEQIQTLLGELGRYAEVTQLMTERFV
jgi:hypothetical protein